MLGTTQRWQLIYLQQHSVKHCADQFVLKARLLDWERNDENLRHNNMYMHNNITPYNKTIARFIYLSTNAFSNSQKTLCSMIYKGFFSL